MKDTPILDVLTVALASMGFVVIFCPLFQEAFDIVPKRLAPCSAELKSEFNVTVVRMTTCEIEVN